ncbi:MULTISPECIES: DUF2187 domain-containing protein [Bacillus cereus group]|uniref:DUF2187 domain-containing protein n=1 Tax=Bacillus cereus group TaxID=86661 RepID=UPI00241463A7|nr:MULTISPECIES: DUF2187 domain-containing protein [Bacillus cereus group]WIK99001.1 DUF2187 domain-containing protein [Bacillus bombysepticus]
MLSYPGAYQELVEVGAVDLNKKIAIFSESNKNVEYVVSVLQNTIVVDITEIMGIEVDDVRQVVKHGYYDKVDYRQIKNNVS